jgi:predicted branched-subunit amino acid permease
LSGGDTMSAQQYMGKGSMSIQPWWAYLWGGVLIVMTGLLGGTIGYVLLYMIPEGMDVQIPLYFIVLPLSIVIPLTIAAMAIVLTRKRN